MKSLTALVQGDSGAGKSWLADSAPKPLLLLDAEGRADHTPSRKIEWDPHNPPPEPDGTWDTAVVNVLTYGDLDLPLQWLESGKHPFRSVAVDSVTELQARLIDKLVGVMQMDQQDWGTALRTLEGDVRRFRDLRKNPNRNIDVLVMLTGAAERNGKQRPMLQGQLASKLAYHFDLVGYLQWAVADDGSFVRQLLIHPAIAPDKQVKDDTHTLGQHYGPYIINPDLSDMLTVLNAPQEAK